MKDKILFFDGAFGTYYFEKTRDFKPCELANIHSPDIVSGILAEYVAAGAQAVKTNSFSANSITFPDHITRNLIIEKAFENAKKAAADKAKVFCDIGYINSDEPFVCHEYTRLAGQFIKAGGENFLFETLPVFSPIEQALAFIKAKNPHSITAVSFAVSSDGYSKSGQYYKNLLKQAENCPYVDIIGLNCQCSPTHMRNLVRNCEKFTKPFLAMPNSSYPSAFDGRMTFDDNSEYFAQKMAQIYMRGADIIGGCCGTTPKHIELAVKRIKAIGQKSPADTRSLPMPVAKNQKFTVSGICQSRKVIAVEVDPPADGDPSFAVSAGFKLKEAGADIITVADSPLARARADSIMTAAKIKRETGIETMPHIACRDKNQIAIKGGLMGASFENINNVLAVTGDPLPRDIYSKKAGVFNFNSFSLMEYIRELNRQIFPRRPICTGGALNVNAANFEKELERAKKKQDCGCRFFMTQPIFTQRALENTVSACQKLEKPVLAGFMPPAGYKNAVFLNNEVSGIEIPQRIIDSLEGADRAKALQISVDYCFSMACRIAEYCGGFYLMTPMKRVDLTVALTEKIRDYLNQKGI